MEELRSARPGDLKYINKICEDIKKIYKKNNVRLWNDEYPTYNMYEEDLAAGNLYVFTFGNKVIGSIAISEYLGEEKLNEGVVSLSRLMIAPMQQNKGYGSKILLGIEDVLKARGAAEIHFIVSINNRRAMGLYTRLGYDLFGYRPMPWEGPEEYYLIFKKKIT